MTQKKRSGQSPFAFSLCTDLYTVPDKALAFEEKLHGSFAVDRRPGHGHLYYGMPGCGLLRISPDLSSQDLIELPPHLTPVNFHSTKIGEFDGQTRLFLAANLDEMVAIVTLEGDVDFVLPRPEFEEYQNAEVIYKPTDTVLAGDTLYVADGYGANYINMVDLSTRRWTGLFGGKTEDSQEEGKFGTAHGLNRAPQDDRLAIADRPHSRIELLSLGGEHKASYGLPPGSRPCGIDFTQVNGRWYAAVGSLDDPQQGRPAPIYILDAETYALISTIRPGEELGVERAEHIHNVVWHQHNGQLFLVCQSWNPGRYFVLELAG